VDEDVEREEEEKRWEKRKEVKMRRVVTRR